MVSLGAANQVMEIAPTLFVKVRSPPPRAPIVESRHLALCEGVDYGGPSGFLGSIVPPHCSNGDVLPLKGKELRQHILVSTVSTFGYLVPLLVQAYL